MLRLLWIILTVQVFAGSINDHFEYIGNDTGTENVRFTLNQLQMSLEDETYKFDYDYTGYVVEEGKPELPVFSTMLEVDPFISYRLEYEIIRSHIEHSTTIRAAGEMTLDKSKHEQGLPRTLSVSGKFPSQFVQVSDPKVMRGHEIIHLEVIPFQFDPSDQSLLVIDELEIKVIPADSRLPIRNREIPRNAAFSPVYEQSILNFSRTEENFDLPPVIIYICGGNLANNANFQQLADWRHKRGYEVHVVSVNDIGSSTTNIKNYIQNAYDNWENPPSFICLVGDATGTYTIPTYHETYSDYYGEGDHPFTLLDGGDQIPDIIIGRLPVRSTSNMSTLATKILIYEKAIDTGNNWYEKAALIGDPSDSGISTIITGEYIQQVMEYEGFEDIRTNFGNGNYSNWMRNQMSEGMLYFSYRGFYDVSGFDQNDIDNTTNGNKLPFCTFLTCGTGSFEDAGVDGGSVCFSEKLVVAGSAANPKGCVTAISTATWGTHTMFNNAVNLGIYEGIFTQHLETAGEALTAGKIHLINSYPSNPNYFATIFCYWNNLMGDPAVHLWTDTPVNPVVEFDTVIPHGENEIEITVMDEFDNPLENANVTLVKGYDEIFITRKTDDEGSVTIPLSYSNAGVVNVTVTGKNIKPFEGSFNIDDNMASINIESSSITLEEVGVSNNDDLWSASETVNLYIPLRNFGNVNVTGVVATLSSETDLVTISTPGVSYGNIATGELAESLPFIVTASETTMDMEPLGLRLVIIDDQGQSWESAVNVLVSGAKFEILDVNIDGNNNYLTPNGTSYLTLDLKNIGTMPVSYVAASLTSLNANIDVLTEMVYDWQTLWPGQSEENFNPFEIEVGDGYINGANVSFLLDVNANGFNQSFTINVPVGQVTVNDPVGPDEYGYYIYDTGDVEYDLAPEYDWIELDPGYGGTGTDINITDNGNNQDESMVVDLPFTVRFYGLDYNEITICSNGWISFGESPMESFRNYNLPGAGGPSPMLAVFWDDLKTTSGGDVFTQYFPGNGEETGMFIVEWSDVRTYDENSRESFQAILYNNIAITPPLGDNEIKLQYNEFNNTSNGYYNIDWWNPPVHGGYCTIGIEDHSGQIGLEYTFNNEYNLAAKQLSDGEALFITTRTGESFPPPTIEISQTEFNFNLGLDETYDDFFTFTNSGEQGSILIYSLDKTGFINPGSGPDASGLMWSDSDREDALNFDWIDIVETGEEVYFIHNDVGSGPVNLEFEFPFYDETYTSCIINPNGWIGFGDDSDDWSNSGLPSSNAPRPAVLGFWDDLNPVSSDEGCSGEESGHAYYQSFGDKFVVTFDQVANCSGSDVGLYTFQIVLTLSGGIFINYNEMSGIVNSATVGVQNAAGYIGHQVVYNSDYVHDELTLLFDKEPEWLSLNTQTSGQLFSGETKVVDYSVNTSGYATGNYTAFITLTSNADELNPLPFNLSLEMGILGDVNDDSLVNVSDIVMIISFILEQNEPNPYHYWASDLNNDGSINVVDIVILVEAILGNL